MDNSEIQSKVLINDPSDEAQALLRFFFQKKGLIGLKDTQNHIVELLKANTDLGAVFLSEDSEADGMSGLEIGELIHKERPELPIFMRKEKLTDEDVDSGSFCEYYSIKDLDRLGTLVDEYLFSRFYPMPLVRGIQEISQEAFRSSILEINVTCDPPYLVKDNIIYGELFSMIPLESEWCRGYMMLQTTRAEVEEMISCGKTHLKTEKPNFRDVNDLMNEITNLIWGGIRSKFFRANPNSAETAKTQVPILVNHNEKCISFGTAEPQLCFKYTVNDNSRGCPSIVIYQKLIFNLDWRPEEFSESNQNVDDMVDSGELELF